MRAVLVRLFHLPHVFAERLFTLFADEGHFVGFSQGMCLLFGVAFGALESVLTRARPPSLACAENGALLTSYHFWQHGARIDT